MPQAPKTLNTFESLLQIISALRGPGGCPWDQEQTHQSLAPYAIEETHEMVEAIEKQDDAHMCEELGDVLFQVILHSSMAEERKAFDIYQVIEGINSKIVRRHPHVFSDTQVTNSAEVLKNWEEIKKAEKLNKPSNHEGALDVPVTLPALQSSGKIGEKTKKLRFDWKTAHDVLTHLKSEIVELEEAMHEAVSKDSYDHIQHEIGDVLFTTAQLARHLKTEPESCLRQANRRFITRFDKMLELGKVDAQQFTLLSSEQKENLWNLAKTKVD